MQRSEIETKLKWDLESLYPTPADIEKDLLFAAQLLDELVAFKGTLMSSEKVLLDFLNKSEDFDRVLSKLIVYGRQLLDVEPKNPDAQEAMAKANSLAEKASDQLSFVQNELIKRPNRLSKFMKTRLLKEFRFNLESTLRDAAHTNTPEIEELLGKVRAFGPQSQQTFQTIRLAFKPVVVDGKEEFLNSATYGLFLENKNRDVRKQAFDNYLGEYKRWSTTFASTLFGHIKYVSFMAKQNKFNSALEASLYDDNVDTGLFNQVLTMANEKYRPLLHRYYKLIKSRMQLDPIYTYDLNVPLVDNVDLKINIEEGQKIAKEALKPLGKEYGDVLSRAFAERWIDFKTHEDKRSGAYSGGCYDSHPFILLNWVDKYDSLSTLVHELGHSVHSYFSNHHNRAANAGYRIFVAEVASIVNEVLLIQYMLKKYEGNAKVRSYLLNNFLVELVGTIFRQPFFAEFEAFLYQTYENGGSLSAKFINDQYLKRSRAYFGSDITVLDEAANGCYSIPHFYYRFYVYKYTIGMVCALAIGKRILSGDKAQLKAYLNFLKSGGSKWPVDLLKGAMVDPTDPQVYDEAFKYFGELLTEFEQTLS